jgi:hypothetical protein
MTPYDEWVLLNPGPADRLDLLTPTYADRVMRSDGPPEAGADAVLAALPVVRAGGPR